MGRRKYKLPLITRFMQAVPGERVFGLYRFLPFFFVFGAALEFSMIKWTVGDTNFYSTFKKRQLQNLKEAQEQTKFK